MPTICPKCRAVRPADTAAPDWQCPSCGVAYAKVGAGASAQPLASNRHIQPRSAGMPWGKLLLLIAVLYGAWVGFSGAGPKNLAEAGQNLSRSGHFGAQASAQQLAQLAARSQASDVLMYSAAWCSNCAAAKGWMAQYGFQFQECAVDTNSACASQLKSLDPAGGVPYLIVKGHHMKDGFDSDEFLAALTP